MCGISGGITENFGEGYEFEDGASRVGSATLGGQSIGYICLETRWIRLDWFGLIKL